MPVIMMVMALMMMVLYDGSGAGDNDEALGGADTNDFDHNDGDMVITTVQVFEG